MTKGKILLLVLGLMIVGITIAIFELIISPRLSAREEALTKLIEQKQENISKHNNSTNTSSERKCRPQIKYVCPPGWRPPFACAPGCKQKLDDCENKYEAIQKFCDVNCQESLEECTQQTAELQQSLSDCYYHNNVLWVL